MPCDDGLTRLEEEQEGLLKEIRELEAMLCVFCRGLEKDPQTFNDFLKVLDWKEAGVSLTSFISWWKNHKVQDDKRKELERKTLEEKTKRQEALAKLSPEEKRLLGLSSKDGSR
jgi:hypothetical protein